MDTPSVTRISISGGSSRVWRKGKGEVIGFLAGFGVGHYFATAPDPRVVGVRASYHFGGN